MHRTIIYIYIIVLCVQCSMHTMLYNLPESELKTKDASLFNEVNQQHNVITIDDEEDTKKHSKNSVNIY